MKSKLSYVGSVLFLVAAILMSKAQAADTPPDVLVKTTTEEVLNVIKQTNDRQKLIQVAESKVLPHFDFNRMTRLAVGRSWLQATPEQQQRLEKEFRDLLVRTYTNALTTGAHRNATVALKPLRMQADSAEVTVGTEVTEPGGKPIAIDYAMEKTPSGWKVYDVTVESVSLVTTYRNSFAAEVKQSGIDGLIKLLSEKNQSLANKKS